MSLDESTQAERDFFASRGRNTDALIAENPDLKADRITDQIPAHEARDTGADTQQRDQREGEDRGPVHVPERQTSQPTVTGVQPDVIEARSGPISEDQDEPGPPGSSHPKRVGWTRYKQLFDEREALAAERKAWLAERQEWTDRFARADERLKLINDAMTPVEQDPDPQPDPTQDAYAHMEWQNRQRERDRQEFQQYLQQQAQRDVETQIVEAYKADAARFASQVPQFGAAYFFAVNSRDAQLQSLEPWRSPQERAQIIKDEELTQARAALEHNQSPAQAIYQLARLWGFDGWYADQLSKQQQTPGAFNSGSNPGANGATGGASPVVPQPPFQQNAGTPSAVQQVQNVIAGQAASRSLSQAGGGNPVQHFSARDLADMSEDEFNAVFSRLQGTGNKARLRELMGA